MTYLTPTVNSSRSISKATLILIPFALTITLLGGISRYIWNSSQAARKAQIQQNRIQYLSGQLTYLDEALTMSAILAATSGDLRWEQRYRSFEPQLNEVFNESGKLLPNIFQAAAIKEANVANTKLVRIENQAFNLVEQGKREAAQALLSGNEYTEQKKIYSQGLQQTTLAMQNYVENLIQTQAQQSFVAVLIILCALVILVISWIFVLRILIRYTSTIKNVVAVAEQISQGNLTTKIAVSSDRDDTGKLLNAFRNMSENLNSLIRQVQQSGVQVTTSNTQIAAAGRELEATMTEQVASTNEVVATAKEIAATSAQLVHTMEEVATMSQNTAIAAGAGQKDLVQMEASMSQLAQATNSISNKLGAISEKANNINSMITTITAVAAQTNLLSLNAAIEAEKAGEYGLGFAVVAREIRRLADQTAVATLDIENMVKEMQSAVSNGVMEMDKFSQEVTQGFEDVRNIGYQIGKIIQQVQALTPRFQAVNEGMEAQSQGAGQISEAMIQLSETSMQSTESLREINRAIAQLNEAANGLRSEISRFKVKD
ncbi:MAG TPA: methyl-accepting chemotaxis protein [Oculatellaceae cyanobacterium]|jgi:methyl-accepting chemotaxis protein WspA